LIEPALAVYPDGTPVFWVQEEPANMSAWTTMRVRFGDRLFGRWPFDGIARPVAASPASGSHKRHKVEQAEIIEKAFKE
jgi:2-oxoglutarate dehydrogenase E1 component